MNDRKIALMSLSRKCFELMLYAYPRDFRREYGPHMSQLFRDCYRDELKARDGNLARLWVRTSLDVIRTAPSEHWDELRRDNKFMNNLRREAIAVLGTLGILVVAFLLHGYLRKHGVGPVLMFGFILDAVVTTGVIGSLLVFLLVKFAHLNPLRTALWVFLAIHVCFFGLAVFIGTRVAPPFPFANVLLSYVVSFLFWYGVHWIWSRTNPSLTLET